VVLKYYWTHPQASNQCKRKCSKRGWLITTNSTVATVTTATCSILQRRWGDRNSGECGAFRAVVRVRGIIANRIKADVRQCWVYTKVVWTERNSTKCGGFPRVINDCEIILSQSVNWGCGIVVLPSQTVRRSWNKYTVFVHGRLFFLWQ